MEEAAASVKEVRMKMKLSQLNGNEKDGRRILNFVYKASAIVFNLLIALVGNCVTRFEVCLVLKSYIKAPERSTERRKDLIKLPHSITS